MKIVINSCLGGFGISSEAAQLLGLAEEESSDISRNDSRLIEMVEKDSNFVSDEFAALEICEVPDEATDWEIENHEGYESVICVIDGKIVHL